MLEKAFTPIRINGLELKNRFIKTATYEGMSRDGIPLESFYDFHGQMAAREVALTTVAYGAVNPDGLTHEHQMVIDNNAFPILEKISRTVHEKGGKISLQLTHCGFFTRSNRYLNRRPLSSSKVFNKYGLMRGRGFSQAMTEKDIISTVRDFAEAAKTAQYAGFDAVEIHMGHGYLLSQFLSPAINKRKDRYGGPLSNRLRFPLQVLQAVRKVTGPEMAVFAKLNMSDDLSNGFTLPDCIETVRLLGENGVDAVTLSGGFTSKTPFYLMRGDVPLREMVESEESYLQKAAIRFFGRRIIKKYEFRENFFLDMAREVRRKTDLPLVYVGGAISGKGVAEIMDSGFDMVALGRALIAEPDFVMKLRNDPGHISPCDHCNKCVGYMEKTGVKCFLDPAPGISVLPFRDV